MSGGSWDYLYGVYDVGNTPRPDVLRRAADRLNILGDPISAERALKAAMLLELAEREFNPLGGYGGPLYYMEWVDSGDCIEADFIKAMRAGWKRNEH
jgi:hypothetical protein